MHRSSTNTSAHFERRGYIMATALMVLIVVSLLAGSLIMRGSTSAAVLGDQLQDYKDHHELLGVRDISEYIAQTIVRNTGGSDRLRHFADTGQRMFDFELPTGARMDFFVYDAQGTLHLMPGRAESASLADLISDSIDRLPPDQFDELTRSVGPAEVSVFAASDAVLLAILGDEAQALPVIQESRMNPELQQQAAFRGALLRDAGLSGEQGNMIARALTFRTILWGLVVRVSDGNLDGPRWYELIVESEGSVMQTRAWRELTVGEAQELGLDVGPDA